MPGATCDLDRLPGKVGDADRGTDRRRAAPAGGVPVVLPRVGVRVRACGVVARLPVTPPRGVGVPVGLASQPGWPGPIGVRAGVCMR